MVFLPRLNAPIFTFVLLLSGLGLVLCAAACDTRGQQYSESPPRGTVANESEAEVEIEDLPRILTVGLVPIDIDTEIEQFLDTPGGVISQCQELNALVSEICCQDFGMGCGLSFECKILPIDSNQRLQKTAYYYEWSEGRPNYAIHHGSVQRDLGQFLNELALLQGPDEAITIAATRHPIMVDDEETKNPDYKINPGDIRSHWLGLVLTDQSDRGGTKIVLDYYSSQAGVLVSLSPLNPSALTQALAERRSGTLSFSGKQLTGTGARDLFRMEDQGRIVPNRLACANLTQD